MALLACLHHPSPICFVRVHHDLQAAEHVGFPAVIKPIHGAASLGVLRVDSQPALAAAYEKVRARVAESGWCGRSNGGLVLKQCCRVGTCGCTSSTHAHIIG